MESLRETMVNTPWTLRSSLNLNSTKLLWGCVYNWYFVSVAIVLVVTRHLLSSSTSWSLYHVEVHSILTGDPNPIRLAIDIVTIYIYRSMRKTTVGVQVLCNSVEIMICVRSMLHWMVYIHRIMFYSQINMALDPIWFHGGYCHWLSNDWSKRSNIGNDW